jgi:hypothetical protein
MRCCVRGLQAGCLTCRAAAKMGQLGEPLDKERSSKLLESLPLYSQA